MSDERRDSPATQVVHAGLAAPEQGDPLLGGPVFAAPYHLSGAPDAAPYGYGRYGNPTWTAYEAALSALEGGEAVVFASGMAAASAVLLPTLHAGDVLVAPSDAYPGVRTVATEYLALRGIEVRLVPTHEDAVRGALEGATLVWIETPSNPGLDLLDVAALAEDVHAAGALLAVDNTLATPLVQRPLEQGADVSVSSATKLLSGHSDLLIGHVAVPGADRADALREWRGWTGAVAGPFEAWLAHRSLATLDVRLERQCSTALALARALEGRDDVSGVRYPGLESHPQHALAARGLGGRFGSVLCFDLGTEERAQAFLAACRLVAEATSFGGVHSTAERRARWGYGDAGPGVIRFSVGVEDPGDLLADVAQALDGSI